MRKGNLAKSKSKLATEINYLDEKFISVLVQGHGKYSPKNYYWWMSYVQNPRIINTTMQ